VKEEEMDGEKRNAGKVMVGNLIVRGHFEDLGINGRIILKWVLNRMRSLGWIHLAQDRDIWS
jgi:hypothetical protein